MLELLLSCCYIRISALSCYCCGQTRMAAGVTGKSRAAAEGQGTRSGVDPPGEDEEKRRGREKGK